MTKLKTTKKTSTIFLLSIVLVTGTFALSLSSPSSSFIIGEVQAQTADYGYNDNNGYNSEYPQEYDVYEKKKDTYYQQKDPPADIVVPRDFPTIQDAINEAGTGDVIKVLPGIYPEQLTISKDLTLLGSGAKSTIIESPPLDELELNVNNEPYIVEINNGAEVSIKGFTIQGIEGIECDNLSGISVLDDGTLNLKNSIIKGCTENSVTIGFAGVGHATITKTFITDYREHGVFAFDAGTTLTMSDNKVVGSAPEELGIIGILIVLAKGTITYNEISNNICEHPDCGENFLTQTQAFGIVVIEGGQGSVISNNYLSNNDGGIDIDGASGCCIIDNNKLINNKFFGVTIVNGEHTISNTKIVGGKVGVAAIALTANTIATLDNVKIAGAKTPIQEIPSGGFTAEVNVVSPYFLAP